MSAALNPMAAAFGIGSGAVAAAAAAAAAAVFGDPRNVVNPNPGALSAGIYIYSTLHYLPYFSIKKTIKS